MAASQNGDDPPVAPDFNLIDEPWIPVVTLDGGAETVSLADLFRRAPELRRIDGEIGTQSFALLRLCLAILQRAFDHYLDEGYDPVPMVEDLREQWTDAAVPDIVDYLAQHRDRFFLFHPTAPFFQVAGMTTDKGEVSSLNKIVAERPPFLATRSRRGLRSIDPADAARWLVHVHAFDVSGIKTGVAGHPRAKGGKVYPEGVGWAGQLGGLHLVGANLKDTLLLNVAAAEVDANRRRRDLPPWEREVAVVGEEQHLAERPFGPVDLYTWQARRVRLVGSRDAVTGVVLTYGDRFVIQERQDLLGVEPMTGWRYSKPQTAKYKRDIRMPREHRAESRLWQGMGPLVRPVNLRPVEEGLPSRLIDHAAKLVLAGSPLLPNGLVRLQAVGAVYGSQSSVLDDIYEDDLDLPAALLDPQNPELRQAAIDAVDAARAGANAARQLGENLAKACGASRESLEGPKERAQENAYSRLDGPYRAWLRTTLPALGPIAAQARWHDEASRLLDELGREMVAQVPPNAWRGYDAKGKRDDVGRVFVWFRNALAKAFPHRSNTVSDGSVDKKEVS
ncbi:type I-E CRISPR-associated protein Cse1/CasA [Nakamurella aerolata]|uniref:Type I-E CRISPR-associated protein Cse1/CasA n=1 Tax=Nakamurella aerolata TaxID=1656892 RepID=A0A849A311_9ACTN|nr:type I-E CRISPR-associated protein Cse1/CasA [Nakamurella aerolata]NNG35424.1 type I-E CRISPR-associated protein Cse1/CasA [Nakamurella aerolata]